LLITAFAVAISLNSCSEQKQNDQGDQSNKQAHENHSMDSHQKGHLHNSQKASFANAELGAAYQHYIHVKEALVASDADESKNGAAAIVTALKKVTGGEIASEIADELIVASDLEGQRSAFANLSNEMSLLLKGSIVSGELYLAFCPMAMDKQGAYWLSNSKEIRNPYFGDKMLTCGSIKEIFQSN